MLHMPTPLFENPHAIFNTINCLFYICNMLLYFRIPTLWEKAITTNEAN